MSLNAIIKHLEETELNSLKDESNPNNLNDKQREYAERIFFEKHLKDCNVSMSDPKFIGRVKMAIRHAKMLYAEIYGV